MTSRAAPARRRCVVVATCAAFALSSCAAASDPAAAPATTPSTSASAPTASASAPSAPASASTPAMSEPSTASVRTIDVTVTGRTVTPAPAVVELKQGQTLRLVVTSDHDDELHAHGFEVETELTAGTPATVELTGAEPGQYEVETHHPALRLMVVQVR